MDPIDFPSLGRYFVLGSIQAYLAAHESGKELAYLPYGIEAHGLSRRLTVVRISRVAHANWLLFKGTSSLARCVLRVFVSLRVQGPRQMPVVSHRVVLRRVVSCRVLGAGLSSAERATPVSGSRGLRVQGHSRSASPACSVKPPVVSRSLRPLAN